MPSSKAVSKLLAYATIATLAGCAALEGLDPPTPATQPSVLEGDTDETPVACYGDGTCDPLTEDCSCPDCMDHDEACVGE